MEEYSIEPQHPDAYLLYLLSLHPPTIERILQEQAQDIAWSLESLLANLEKHVPRFIGAFRAY